MVAVVILYCPRTEISTDSTTDPIEIHHTCILQSWKILQYHLERFMNYVTTVALGTSAVHSTLVGKVIPMQQQQQLTSYCAS